MMCYKDMTFCPGPCGNYDCFRHKSHIDEAYKEGNFLHQNSFIPVAWFVEMPDSCEEYMPPNPEAA